MHDIRIIRYCCLACHYKSRFSDLFKVLQYHLIAQYFMILHRGGEQLRNVNMDLRNNDQGYRYRGGGTYKGRELVWPARSHSSMRASVI